MIALIPVPIAAAALPALDGLSLSTTISALRKLIADPFSNLALAMLVLAAVALVLLLAIVVLLYLAAPRRTRIVRVRRFRRRPAPFPVPEGSFAGMLAAAKGAGGDTGGESRSPDDAPDAAPPVAPSKPTPARRSAPAWLASPFLIAALVLLALGGTWYATSTDAYCAQTCHGTHPAVASASKRSHATCVECHEAPGPAGAVDGLAARTRMVFASLGGATPGAAVVPSAGCLRCHRSVTAGVLVSPRGIRVSHAEPLAAGEPCTACHRRTGHAASRVIGGMAPCIRCHDSRQASAACSTCHTGDPATVSFDRSESTATISGGKVLYPTVLAAKRNCGGCHDEKRTCDPCHGLRMPHSASFLKGGHARSAGFERKRTCWRCHESSDCTGRCHTEMRDDGGVSGHPDNWKQVHATFRSNAGCGCHSMRSGRKGPMCALCH